MSTFEDSNTQKPTYIGLLSFTVLCTLLDQHRLRTFNYEIIQLDVANRFFNWAESLTEFTFFLFLT